MSIQLIIEIDELDGADKSEQKILEKLISDWDEIASKSDLSAECISITDEGNCDMYNIADGWNWP